MIEDNNTDLKDIVLWFFRRHGYIFSGKPAILKIVCPICKTDNAKVYTGLGTWCCESCSNAGDFNKLQELIAGQVESDKYVVQSPERRNTCKTNSVCIKSDGISSLSQQFHQYLLSKNNLLQYVEEKMGIDEKVIRKYKMGWSARRLLHSDKSYLRNRLTFPVYSIDNEIRVIRFNLINDTPGTSSQTSPVLNLWSQPEAFIFIPKYNPQSTKIWVVKNEFEAIMLNKCLRHNGLNEIMAVSPICQPHVLPSQWYGWDYIAARTVVFFVPNRKYNIAVANKWAFDIGRNASISVYPERFPDLQSIFDGLGEKGSVKFLLNLESGKTSPKQKNETNKNTNISVQVEKSPFQQRSANLPQDVFACINELKNMCQEIGYPGFFYLADFSNRLNNGLPYFMKHYWNWRLVRKTLKEIGINQSKKERTKKGYKIYLSEDELKAKIDKFKR